MKLPNIDRAVVDVRKLRDYCFSREHPRGQHKARVFQSAFGWTAASADDVRL
jgi:sarcosine oxidase delta subunit